MWRGFGRSGCDQCMTTYLAPARNADPKSFIVTWVTLLIQCIFFSVLHGVVLHPSVQLHMMHLNNNNNNYTIYIILYIIIQNYNIRFKFNIMKHRTVEKKVNAIIHLNLINII